MHYDASMKTQDVKISLKTFEFILMVLVCFQLERQDILLNNDPIWYNFFAISTDINGSLA